MPSSNLADMKAHIPGDYVFTAECYEITTAFREDLAWTERFCGANGYFFEVVTASSTGRAVAFFVHIRRIRRSA